MVGQSVSIYALNGMKKINRRTNETIGISEITKRINESHP